MGAFASEHPSFCSGGSHHQQLTPAHSRRLAASLDAAPAGTPLKLPCRPRTAARPPGPPVLAVLALALECLSASAKACFGASGASLLRLSPLPGGDGVQQRHESTRARTGRLPAAKLAARRRLLAWPPFSQALGQRRRGAHLGGRKREERGGEQGPGWQVCCRGVWFHARDSCGVGGLPGRMGWGGGRLVGFGVGAGRRRKLAVLLCPSLDAEGLGLPPLTTSYGSNFQSSASSSL